MIAVIIVYCSLTGRVKAILNFSDGQGVLQSTPYSCEFTGRSTELYSISGSPDFLGDMAGSTFARSCPFTEIDSRGIRRSPDFSRRMLQILRRDFLSPEVPCGLFLGRAACHSGRCHSEDLYIFARGL